MADDPRAKSGVDDPSASGQFVVAHTPEVPTAARAQLRAPVAPPPPAAPAPAVPGYELHEVVGSGGMGIVYRARDTRLDRDIALKFLLYGGPPDSDAARRFVAEAKITARLQHPGIPAVHEVGELADGRPYLAMKLIRGRTLAALLTEQGHGSAKWLGVFEAICQAVGYAHSEGVIHRDLKPLNVMVGAFGEVQVMDWGLAKRLANPERERGGVLANRDREGAGEDALTPRPPLPRPGEGEEESANPERERGGDSNSTDRTNPRAHTPPDSPDATRHGLAMGTPLYMPPEQARGDLDRIDRRADVFALGAVLCELLTGKQPLAGEPNVMQAARDGRFDAAYRRLDECGEDRELITLAKRCLAANPDDRPSDASEVATAVAAFRAAADARAKQAEVDRGKAEVKVAEQWRRRWISRAAIAFLTLGIAGTSVGLVLAYLAKEEEKKRADGETKAKDREAEERVKAVTAGVLAVKKEKTATVSSTFMKSILVQGSAKGQATRERAGNPKLTMREALDFAAKKIEGAFPDDPEIEADLRNTIGEAYLRLAAHAEAERHLKKALSLREAALGPDHPDTLESVSELAVLYTDKGDYAAAEPLNKRALAWFERVRGADHPDTLRSVSNLASLYHKKTDYAAAEPLLKRVLAGFEKALGPEHPDTLTSVNNLAELHQAKGESVAAELHHKRALDGREKLLGPDHPDTLTSVNNLAGLYVRKGEHMAAEPLLKRVLAGFEKALGPDHPITLTSVTILATLYHDKADYAAAEPLFKRALAGLEKALGPEHPDTLTSVNNLAGLYVRKGEHMAAEPLLKRLLAGQEKALGPDHPDTLASMNSLATLYHDKKDYPAAEPLHKRALAGFEKIHGPDHPTTLRSANNLGALYSAKGDYPAAEPLLKRALAGKEKVLGPDHPETLTSLSNLGALYQDKGDYAAAEPLLVRALTGKEKALGPDHPDTLWCVNNLAMLYHDKADYAAAEPLLKRALARFEKVLGPDHPDTLASMHNLGSLYLKKNDYPAAEPLLQRLLAGQEKVLGPDHPDTLWSVSNLGAVYHHKKDYPAAEPLFKRALAGCEKVHGADHPETLACVNNLASLYHGKGDYAAAEPLFKRALAGCEKVHGADHPDTMTCVHSLAILYWRTNRLDRSIPLLENAVKRKRAKLGDSHPDTLNSVASLGVNYRDAGRLEEAIPLLEGAHRGVGKHPQLAWASNELLTAYTKAGKRTEASGLIREQLATARKQLKPESAELGGQLAMCGKMLLELGSFTDAEPVLRECLTIREKLAPKAWNTANAKSLLGGALLGQKKHADAEPLLLAGYDGLKADAAAIPPQGKTNLPDAAERLIQLYTALDKPDEVAKWRAERTKYPRETLPPPRRE